jgi:hypothetical protein
MWRPVQDSIAIVVEAIAVPQGQCMAQFMAQQRVERVAILACLSGFTDPIIITNGLTGLSRVADPIVITDGLTILRRVANPVIVAYSVSDDLFFITKELDSVAKGLRPILACLSQLAEVVVITDRLTSLSGLAYPIIITDPITDDLHLITEQLTLEPVEIVNHGGDPKQHLAGGIADVREKGYASRSRVIVACIHKIV